MKLNLENKVRNAKDVIYSTPAHPFKVKNSNTRKSKLGNNWVYARDLRAGDEVQLVTGKYGVVSNTTRETTHLGSFSCCTESSFNLELQPQSLRINQA
jgi:hypothetical protein